MNIAVLDDYQQVALQLADWSNIQQKASLTVFTDHIAEEARLIERLLSFEILCVMRERTPLPRRILAQLPKLKLIVSTGRRNASIDMVAAEELGIAVMPTGYIGRAPELTWALLMGISRHFQIEIPAFKNGQWQQTIGSELEGRTLGIVGLGNIGSTIARYAKAFNMNIIAWSQNLTEEKATAAGAKLVSKEELFKQSDFVTVHLVLSGRTKRIIGAPELESMKPTAFFVNTSRGPLVDEQALIKVLQEKKIAGAALDVFDEEPLPANHPFRTLPNVLGTSHIGYVTQDTYKLFYEDTVKAIEEYLKK
jgi:phosphoglycerate dehydrogenase-like enzyme